MELNLPAWPASLLPENGVAAFLAVLLSCAVA